MKTNPRTITLSAVFKAAYIASLSTEDSIGAGRSKAVQTLSSAQQHNITMFNDNEVECSFYVT